LIAAIITGSDMQTACIQANEAGAAMVSHLGAVEAWKQHSPS
jgi:sugar/nucleoside kinase (ribokinase family)